MKQVALQEKAQVEKEDGETGTTSTTTSNSASKNNNKKKNDANNSRRSYTSGPVGAETVDYDNDWDLNIR
jgi:hypothetical protein